MLALLSLLQTRRDWPGGVLADRLGVTSRTVRRDVERLRDLGYEIASAPGRDGGYRLSAGTQMPPLLLDDDQTVALAVALQTVAGSGIDVAEAAERALVTVRQLMPSRLAHRMDRIRFEGAAPIASVSPRTLEMVGAAVRDRVTLRFDYAGATGLARQMQPHAVVVRNGRWYVIGWEDSKEDWRVFRLDRLSLRTPHGAVFVPRALPAPDAQTFLAARLKGSAADDRWPCVGQVRLELPLTEVAPFVGDGHAEDDGPAATLLTIGSWSWAGIIAQVTRFDAPFRILGPSALHAAALETAQRIASAADAHA